MNKDYLTDELNKIILSLNNDLKRYKNITQEILKGLKRLATGYLALSSDFASKNKLFDFIMTSERIDLDYEMKMTREFTVESVTNIVQKISNYVIKTEEKINVISNEIDKIIGEL